MMLRLSKMALGLAALLIGAGSAGAQSWSAGDARRMHNFVESGVPEAGYVPNAYYTNQTLAPPPNAYYRRAAPGGLIETAARRVNPLSSLSQAGNVVFAPEPYRQAHEPTAYRVGRPAFGAAGYPYGGHHGGGGVVGGIAPPSTTGHVPGVTCPTCPR